MELRPGFFVKIFFMIQKSFRDGKPKLSAYKNENIWFVAFSLCILVLENNTRVVPHDSQYVRPTTRVLFTSTYTAKQLQTMYHSLNHCLYQD